MPFLLIILLSAFACPAFAVNAELIELRTQAKHVVESRHCYNCHSPQGKRPLTEAMKVYDLSKEGWFSAMSDRQLKDFKRRILTYLTPDELKEMGGDPHEKPLAQSQEKIVTKWVDAEIVTRHPDSLEKILFQ